MKHFISILDFSPEEIKKTINIAIAMKNNQIETPNLTKLFWKKFTVAGVFEKSSLRTRISFDVATAHLWGNYIHLTPENSWLWWKESWEDVTKVVSSMTDLIVTRTYSDEVLETMKKHSSVPVISWLDAHEHPCQVLADLMTIKEVFGSFEGLKMAYLGDADNNVTYSLAYACGLLWIDFTCAAPQEYQMKEEKLKKTKEIFMSTSANFTLTNDPQWAVKWIDIVVTDTRTSVGKGDEEMRVACLLPYQVNDEIMASANEKAMFLHCLPAYREKEVTSSVIDGEQSYVFQEAENRLHAQKAIMLHCLWCTDYLEVKHSIAHPGLWISTQVVMWAWLS